MAEYSTASPYGVPDEEIIAAFTEHVNPALAHLLQFIGLTSVEAEARGCRVRDTRGREFLDCVGSYGVLGLGHSHPRVIAAVKAQLDRQAFSTRLLFPAPQALLAKKLAEIAPGNLQYAFFCNSGSEAAEAAIKFARLATGRRGLVSAQGAYHGKTLGALSISGRELYKEPFAPLVPECVTVPFNDIAALEAAVSQDTAAVLLEPIQGEGGVIIATDEYLQAARRICDEHGALLVFDEVQTGLGRTGKLWGSDWSGVAPDLMMLAKALSGGCVPIGAVLGTPEVWKIWEANPLIHSSTFGGNPLACAAGLAALEVIADENLVEKSAQQGAKLMAKLRATQAEYSGLIKDVRGRGSLIGVEFADADIGNLVIAALVGYDVLAAYTLNNPTVIRFLPPFVISDEEIEWAARAFHDAMGQTQTLLDSLEEEE
jgi:putrescine aminotransferase